MKPLAFLRAFTSELFHRSRAESEMEEELRAHIRNRADDLELSGLPRPEAERRARVQFGSVERFKEECREARGTYFLESVLQDIRHAIRLLRKSPGFAFVAILTLALGIGANAAIFSIGKGIFLGSFPVPRAGTLVSFGFLCKGNPGVTLSSYADLRDIRRQSAGLASLFAYQIGIDGLTVAGHTYRTTTNYITGNYFDVLGVRPALGRLILPSEGKPGGYDPVLVLSYSYWQSRFGADPSIIGKTVRLNGKPVTVVGVAQKGFHGTFNPVNAQAFLPLNLARGPNYPWTNRQARNLYVMGRLRSGVSLTRANAAMEVIASRLAREHPKSDPGATAWLLPARDAQLTPFPKPGDEQKFMAAFAFFLALALVVLLLACFNLANLLLARATAREHEMVTRAALGAGPGRLLRQVLTESFLLAALGCGAGILVGVWATGVLQAIHIDAGFPMSFHFDFGAPAFTYTACVALLAALLVGIVPAWRASRSNPSDALHGGGRTVIGGRSRLRSLLLVAQIGGSVVLLVVAGLFTHGSIAAEHMDLGFNPSHLVKLNLDPHEAGYDQTQGREFDKSLLQRVRTLPGVQSASLAFTYPSNFSVVDYRPVQAEGRPIPPGQAAPLIGANVVSPGYFRTLQIPILRGRPFLETDTATSSEVAIVNETFARRLWPNQGPLGKRFSVSGAAGPWIKVVGIAGDSLYGQLSAKPTAYFYLPASQNYISFETLLVRTEGPPEAMLGSVEARVRAMASAVPVWGAETMRQTLDDSPGGFYTARLGTTTTLTLGLLALLLAVWGVYGVISYAMSRRVHEIGIRIALGARPAEIQRIALRQGLVVLAVGVSLGLLAALGLAPALRHALVGFNARDPLTYVGVTVLISAATLLACYIPARRAAKVDPMTALRHE